jgi:hypothetical protein
LSGSTSGEACNEVGRSSPHQARFAVVTRIAESSTAIPRQTDTIAPDIVPVLRDSLRQVRAMVEMLNHGSAQTMHQSQEMLSQRIAALEAELAAHRAALSGAEMARDIARARLVSLEMHTQNLHRALEEMRASSSWRLTAPLRGFARRHPRLAHRLAAFAARHPAVRRDAVWLARNLWRIITRRPLVVRTPSPARTAGRPA